MSDKEGMVAVLAMLALVVLPLFIRTKGEGK